MTAPAQINGDHRPALVLGIETSCDETAAAVVSRDAQGRGAIRSNIIRAQWDQHGPFGGVVPELAARAHLDTLDGIIAQAMREADANFGDLDAIAVTAGPGLIGGLLVGVMTAKALSLVHEKPLVAVNHLEAHALTVGLTDGVAPPYLLLLVSGGHTQLVHVREFGDYVRLGSTIDDALGEAFDKTAKLLGLPQPGGPAVERLAARGRPDRIALPRPLRGRPEPHFSFAGLKTAVRLAAQGLQPLDEQAICDICASFQAAVAETVADRVNRAIAIVDPDWPQHRPRRLVAAGGVAANAALRASLAAVAAASGFQLVVPPPLLCTDNAAMIAWTGIERATRGLVDGLDATTRARWPLDALATPVLGKGRLGAKA
jgi:N6-L-threonylcarbamoyladenine synthase